MYARFRFIIRRDGSSEYMSVHPRDRAPGCRQALCAQKKTADLPRFLVELAGLEPATSWVRSTHQYAF
jgi:hypothetical protein